MHPQPISLHEWNAQRKHLYNLLAAVQLQPNRIACPDCSLELVDTTPIIVDASVLPPLMPVHCPRCQFRGFRVV